MVSSFAARVLLGVGALGVAGGTTALAAAPATSTPAPSQHKDKADRRQGVVVKLSDTSITVEREVRDKTTKAVTRDDTTFAVNATTRVFRAGSKDPVGHDALKLGERVRVRFSGDGNDRVARTIVILPDLRAGKVIAKGNDYFVLHTPKHGDVKVVVTDRTRYRSGKQAGSFAALKVGDRAIVAGEEDSAHNFDAAAVHYHAAPEKRGTRTAPAA